MLKDKNKEPIARQWLNQIENKCIFGELSHYNNEIVIIIFNDLTRIQCLEIKEKGLLRFGVNKVLYSEFVGLNDKKFIFKEV